jgi:integrase
MSVHANRVGGYDCRWYEPDQNATLRKRSKSFKTWRDADRYDRKIKTAKDTGTLRALDGGRETLDQYVTVTWIPVHVAPLAPSTRALYAGTYDRHIAPTLGQVPLRELGVETIARWQAGLIAAGVGAETVRKAHSILSGCLQRAYEAGRIAGNPARLVRKAAPPAREEVRPLAPAAVERIRGSFRAGAGRDRPFVRDDLKRLGDRDAMLVSLLAYAGLRPQEALGLRWAHVQANTLIVHAPKTRRHRAQPRTVRLLAPLAQDLREWRLASGVPGDDAPVIPGLDGGVWSEVGYEQWRAGVWASALAASGIPYQRPYDLRHSFASLLLHEGRSVIYVARQLGHSATLTMTTYGHVIEELEDQPRITAEQAIAAARREADSRTDSRTTGGGTD